MCDWVRDYLLWSSGRRYGQFASTGLGCYRDGVLRRQSPESGRDRPYTIGPANSRNSIHWETGRALSGLFQQPRSVLTPARHPSFPKGLQVSEPRVKTRFENRVVFSRRSRRSHSRHVKRAARASGRRFFGPQPNLKHSPALESSKRQQILECVDLRRRSELLACRSTPTDMRVLTPNLLRLDQR